VLCAHVIHRRPAYRYPGAAARYELAIEIWMTHLGGACDQMRAWRQLAIGCAALVLTLAMTFAQAILERPRFRACGFDWSGEHENHYAVESVHRS